MPCGVIMCVGPIIIIDESNRANPNIKCMNPNINEYISTNYDVGFGLQQSKILLLFWFSISDFFVGTVLNWYRLLECYRRQMCMCASWNSKCVHGYAHYTNTLIKNNSIHISICLFLSIGGTSDSFPVHFHQQIT